MNEENLIMFPQYDELVKDNERLRTELSMLVLERDELMLVICKNIETEYLINFGGLEHRVYEAECRVRRLKRKIELIRAKQNRQEKVNMDTIELKLDAEFEQYEKQLEDQLDKMNEALDRQNAQSLSDSDSAELRKLYRKIIKALHPDLNTDTSEGQLAMFRRAVEAYGHGDLSSLRIIASTLSDPAVHEPDKGEIIRLTEQKKKLKELLENPEKMEARKKELGETEKQYLDQLAYYQGQLSAMI